MNTTKRTKHGRGRQRSKRGSSPLMMAVYWVTSLVAAVVVGFVIINTTTFESLRTWLAGGDTVAAIGEPNSMADGTASIRNSRKSAERPGSFETADVRTTDDSHSDLPTEDKKSGVVLTGHQGPLTLPAKPATQQDPSQTKLDQEPDSETQTDIPSTDNFSQELDQDGLLVIKPGQMSLKPFQVVDSTEREIPSPADSPVPQQAPPRLPIPDSNAQRTSLKEIQTLLKGYLSDRTPAGVATYANLCLKTGLETKDQPTDQFVLLRESLDSAIEIGDVETAFKASDAIAGRFQVDEFDLLLSNLNGFSTKLRDVQTANELLMTCNGKAKTLIAADNYADAKKLIVAMKSIARKGKMQSWNEVLKDEERSIDDLAKSYKKFARQFDLLKLDPLDANANQAVGEYYCFVKGDFDKGLQYLSKGNQPVLKEIVALDLSDPVSVEDQLAVADSWWDYATNLDSESESQNTYLHAAKFYRRIVNETSGITQTRIRKRLETSEAQSSGVNSPQTFEAMLIKTPWMLTWSNGSKVEIKFDASGKFNGTHFKGAKYKGTWRLVNRGNRNIQVQLDFENSVHLWTPQEHTLAVVSKNKKTGTLTYGSAVATQ